MMLPAFPYSPAPQRGFTLVEVLVAALVLSIGILGLAGLQATAQKLRMSAYQRSQAASLAYELADAIRANARNANAYLGVQDPDACDTNLSRSTTGPTAADDLSEWANRIACTLPAARGSIIANGNIVNIRLDWGEERVRGTDTAAPEGSGEDLRDQFTIAIQI